MSRTPPDPQGGMAAATLIAQKGEWGHADEGKFTQDESGSDRGPLRAEGEPDTGENKDSTGDVIRVDAAGRSTSMLLPTQRFASRVDGLIVGGDVLAEIDELNKLGKFVAGHQEAESVEPLPVRRRGAGMDDGNSADTVVWTLKVGEMESPHALAAVEMTDVSSTVRMDVA